MYRIEEKKIPQVRVFLQRGRLKRSGFPLTRNPAVRRVEGGLDDQSFAFHLRQEFVDPGGDGRRDPVELCLKDFHQVLYRRAQTEQGYHPAAGSFGAVVGAYIEVDENHATAYSWLFLVFDLKGDDAAAYEWFLKNQKRTNTPHLAAFQTAYETSGWQGVRQKKFELEKLNENPSTNHYGMARQCALLGEKEQAFAYLNKAVEKHQGQMTMLNVEPAFDALRDDLRFDELVRRVGLK